MLDVILKKYFWVLNLLAIAICMVFAGRATADLLVSMVLAGEGPAAPGARPALPPPPSPTNEPVHNKDIELVLQRNIFCSTCAPLSLTPEKDKQEGPVDTTPQRSSLQLQLLVTMLSPDVNWSMAVIRDTQHETRRTGIFRRGDSLPQGATVAQVVDRRVYLVVGQRVEYIDQDGAPPPAAPPPAPVVASAEPMPGDATGLEKDIEKGVRCSGSSCEIDRSLVDKVLANTTALATSARFVPSIKDGKPNGFKVYAIRPGSVFAKLGMQNADLVKSINGLDMSTPDKALEAYTKLKSASHLTMTVERHGANVTLDYQIR
jgi:general secretion pathway protein C